MKRDYLNEISELKNRSSIPPHYNFDLYSVGRSLELIEVLDKAKEFDSEISELNREIMKAAPISIVACFEGFFKSVCTELIDSGQPFIENTKAFNARDIKFDFEIVSAIQSKRISIGEFITHMLSFSSIESINSNLSLIIKSDFLRMLLEFNKVSVYEDINELQKNFRTNYSLIMSSIARVYEIRNIFCHEYAAETNISIDELKTIHKHCHLFLEQSKLAVSEILFPNAPETQIEITQAASNEFDIADKELVIVLEQLINADNYKDDERTIHINKMIDAWKQYRTKRAEFEGNPVFMGTIYNTVYYSSMTQTTRELIGSLKNQYKGIFKTEPN